MKYKILTLLLLLSYFDICSADQHLADREVLTNIKTSIWPNAYKHADVKQLDKLLHSTFKLVDAKGNVANKSQELAFLADYKWPHENFTYTITSMEITGETAVVIGTGKASGKGAESAYCFTYTSSNVLIKQGANWRAVLSHVSGYEPKCED